MSAALGNLFVADLRQEGFAFNYGGYYKYAGHTFGKHYWRQQYSVNAARGEDGVKGEGIIYFWAEQKQWSIVRGSGELSRPNGGAIRFMCDAKPSSHHVDIQFLTRCTWSYHDASDSTEQAVFKPMRNPVTIREHGMIFICRLICFCMLLSSKFFH